MALIVGVGAVVTSPDHPGEILVVTEAGSNAAIGKEEGMLALPSGTVERGESLEEAVIREILEETGVTVRVASLLGFYLIDGAFGVAYHCIAKTDTLTPAKGEIICVSWMTPEAFLSPGVSRRPANHAVVEDYLAGKSYPQESIRDCRIGA